MADVFGDLDLFSEFDKDREAQGSFIHYDEDNVKSRIIFEDYESENESESEGEYEPANTTTDVPKGEDVVDDDKASPSDNTEDGEVDSKNPDAKDGSSGDATSNRNVNKPVVEQQLPKVSTEDEDRVAWLNAQLYAEAAEEAKRHSSSVQHLIYERNKLRRYAKILDSTRFTPDDESPAVQLIFNNNSFARKYRQQIEQFIKSLLWEEFRTPKETLSEVTVKPGRPSCVDINSSLPPEKRNENMRQKHALIGNSQFHKQFLIDNLGWPFNIAEPARCNVNWEIPLYGQVFNEVYADPTNKPAKPAGRGAKPKPSCWNCGEQNHSVSDCVKPRNQAKIMANKKEFLMQQNQNQSQGPKFSGPSRYHMDPELASKFSRFAPGDISDKLREALGLKEDQLPHHIYKMRLYGYPPGWLAEAKQVQSGVTIFDKHGRVALITGEHLEDGELDDNDVESKTEYDVNKIIEYPGFTIPVPLGVTDEHSTHKMPPIQEHQLKKTLMSQSEKPPSKKRKRAAENDEKADEAKKLKSEAQEANGEEGEVIELRSPSADGGEDENTEDKMEEDDAVPSTPSAPATAVPPQIERSSSTISMSRDFGTPIFAREKALPDASKFGKDIEEHIPFENLPNATGTFEKMKDLIDLIRKKTRKQN